MAATPTALQNAIRTGMHLTGMEGGVQRVPLYPTRDPEAPWFTHVLAPVRSRWAYQRILYLALMFPLGLLYFVSLLPGTLAGAILSWTIPGLALLILVVVAARWYGDLEALLARRLAGIEIRRPPTWYERDVPIREQAKQVLLDPSTWTGFAYLFSRFPLGIAAFMSLAVGTAFTVGLTLAPLAYEGWGPLFGNEEVQRGWMELGWWRIDSQREAWFAVPFGLLAGLISLHVWNLQAWLMGWWARVMLGSRARDIPAPPAALEDGPSVLPASAVQHASIAALTPREREVLLLIARGYSNAEIAESFVVSEGTVKTHVKRILSKLDVRDRTQAAVFAFDSGFVTPETASEPELR